MIQLEDEVIETELIPAYGTRSYLGSYSEYVTVVPVIEQNGERVSIGSRAKEKEISSISEENYALRFDGNGDYVTCPNTYDTYHVGDHTYMTWIKVENSPLIGTTGILGHYNWRISTSTNIPRFTIVYQYPPSEANIVNSNTTLAEGEWQHYAAVYDYDATNGEILLYLDGELVGNGSIGDHTIETNYNTGQQNLIMGFSNHGNTEYLLGEQDDVRIYNRTLTQEEIRENMYNKLTGNEPNLVGYWNFNEGSGNTLSDLTGTHNCDLNGDPQFVEVQ